MSPDQVREVAPALERYTQQHLYGEAWKRPGLSPRNRSLVSIAALIADGKSDQLPYHLNRGMAQGLTQGQIGEVLTRLAFYAGWPSIFVALSVVKQVFAERAATAPKVP